MASSDAFVVLSINDNNDGTRLETSSTLPISTTISTLDAENNTQCNNKCTLCIPVNLTIDIGDTTCECQEKACLDVVNHVEKPTTPLMKRRDIVKTIGITLQVTLLVACIIFLIVIFTQKKSIW
jgi:hypothetical protein